METTQKQKQQYKYFAFISYSSKDKLWGRKLQQKLEGYRLPARLRKKHENLPARVYPIFRDDTDLSGVKVRSALERELDDSQYLVVICSPKSANSDWVNAEIQYFIDRGKEDKILPFIVEGTPYSGNPETECFPPALRNMKEEPLGADIQAQGQRRAFLRLISTMLNVRYDDLFMRDTRRRIHRGILCGIAGLALTVSLALGIWQNTEHSKYYNAYTYQREIPVGIRELTKQERSAMSDCYRITTLGGKVVRLECVNALGIVVDPIIISSSFTEYPILEFQYNDDGELISVLQKDATGKEVSSKYITANWDSGEAAIDFRSAANSLDAQALPADMTSYVIGTRAQTDKSTITRQRNTYDENGYLIRSLFQRDNLGTPACDSNGVYGKSYVYQQGQIVRVNNLNEKGELHNCKYGWAYQEFTYDDMGNEVQSQYYDADGRKAVDQDGVSGKITEYDHGNVVCLRYLDQGGNLTYCENGYAFSPFQYDDHGLIMNAKGFGPGGSPVYDKDGIHEYRYTHDSNGRISGISYYDTEGKPVNSTTYAYASMQRSLDGDGHILKESYYDENGQPCYCSEGYATYKVVYENGNCVSGKHFDAQGKPTLCKASFYEWRNDYDEKGNCICRSYFDTEGNLVRRSPGGFAIEKPEYDAYGNLVRVSYFDERGNPCYHLEGGYSSIKIAYENGNEISCQCFDTQGEPMLCNEYYHEYRNDYDEKGNCIRRSFFDTEGNLLERAGDAILEWDYDAYGNVTERRVYTPDRQLSPTCDVYRYVWKYDTRGNLVREERYAAIPEGLDYVIAEYQYDDYGNRIQEDFYGEGGSPLSNGVEQRKQSYDSRKKCLYREDCYSTDESFIYEFAYDELGNKIYESQSRRETSGEVTRLHQARLAYDSFGNCIRTDYLDGDGNPRLLEHGYASVAKGCSPSGYVEWEEYYDENGEPCLYDGIYFRAEYKRDVSGNETEKRIYGVDGTLCKLEETGWAAIVQRKYNLRGLETYMEEFDENEKSLGAIETVYDPLGYQVEKIYYDGGGKQKQKGVLYAYIHDVVEGYSACEAGIQANQIIIQLNDWNYYEAYAPSSPHALRGEADRAVFREKDLILCELTEEDTFVFRRYQLPKGEMGIAIQNNLGDSQVLERMKEAYFQWLEQEP